ncbi:MAG: addiction module protein [Bacteroidota bacterium]
MNLQYISDSSGKITGVFIPILEWNELKRKYDGIDDESAFIPQWHRELVSQRLIDYQNDPSKALDFDQAMEEIDQQL